MLCPRPAKVSALENYKLLIEFENGEKKLFDVTPYLFGDWFGALKNEEEFRSVRISNRHVTWRGGQDIAPHELYENSVSV